MSQLEKLQEAFRVCRGPFAFDKFEKMMRLLGYEYVSTGSTGGSRRRMYNNDKKHLVRFHEPHGNEMGVGTVQAIKQDLIDKGVI